jgi:hypothetical protein
MELLESYTLTAVLAKNADQMDASFHSSQSFFPGGNIADIAGHGFRARLAELGGIASEHVDLVAGLNEPLNYLTTDEPATPRDEYFHSAASAVLRARNCSTFRPKSMADSGTVTESQPAVILKEKKLPAAAPNIRPKVNPKPERASTLGDGSRRCFSIIIMVAIIFTPRKTGESPRASQVYYPLDSYGNLRQIPCSTFEVSTVLGKSSERLTMTEGSP